MTVIVVEVPHCEELEARVGIELAPRDTADIIMSQTSVNGSASASVLVIRGSGVCIVESRSKTSLLDDIRRRFNTRLCQPSENFSLRSSAQRLHNWVLWGPTSTFPRTSCSKAGSSTLRPTIYIRKSTSPP